MNAYVLTPLASQDVFSIWCYIASDDEDAANRVEAAIFEGCDLIADGPMRGHSRSELTSRTVRFWTLTRFPNYAIVYRPFTTPVQVIAVVHGRRNLRRVLKERK